AGGRAVNRQWRQRRQRCGDSVRNGTGAQSWRRSLSALRRLVWRRAGARADVQKIRQLGFNTVRCWVDWSSAEPQPGHYDFRHTRQMLELAEEQGLKVIIQVYMDSAPDWVGRQYPDSHFVANSGDVIESQAAPGFCPDHSGVQRAILNFYATLARTAGKSRAFYGWDLWSEPHIINWATMQYMVNPEFCFCRHTAARFRGWLEKKYGSL